MGNFTQGEALSHAMQKTITSKKILLCKTHIVLSCMGWYENSTVTCANKFEIIFYFKKINTSNMTG